MQTICIIHVVYQTFHIIQHHTIIKQRLFVCLFVPYLLRGPLTDLRQTWWVYVGGPPICP